MIQMCGFFLLPLQLSITIRQFMKKFLLSLFCLTAMSAWAGSYEVSSPNGKVKVTVEAGSMVNWSVSYDGKAVLQPSVIDISVQQGKKTAGLGKVGKVSKKFVTGSFKTPFYKKAEVADSYGQLVLYTNQKWSIEIGRASCRERV